MSFSDLPLLSDLIKSHKCKYSVDGSSCTCQLVSAKKAKPVIDNRLRNWQEWMQRRKELHQKLGKLLHRKPGGLAMNSAEEYRIIKEKQIAMQYTNIRQPDPHRGCPSFWKMPLQLKDECGKETSCFGVLQKEEKCEIPVIEHVGIPQEIMKEKDILPRTRNLKEHWEQSTYVQERMAKLDPKMEVVDPYKPDFEHLLIKGISLDNRSNSKPLQQVVFSQIKTVANYSVAEFRDSSALCLSINDFQVAPHFDIVGTRKVYVIFDYDIITRKVDTEYLIITNHGTTTLRFYWRAAQKAEFFKDIIPEKNQPVCFYFDKNEGLIIPGQTIKFPIWFRTEDAGTYSEFWEFYTKPTVLPPNTRLLLTLLASATVGDLDEKIGAIQERLNNNIRERMIKDTLSSVLNNVSYEKFKPTIYSYNKKEVFETVNSRFDPLNNQPKYMYNKDVIRELQNFYKKVRRRSDPKCWNYRINELRLLSSARQKKEDQLKYLAEQEEADKIKAKSPKLPSLLCDKITFANLHVDNKRVSHEKKIDTETNNNKNQNDVDGLQNAKAAFDKKTLTEQLEAILKKLEHPATEQNVEQTKYTQAYLILSTCFDKVSEEFEVLEESLGIIRKTRYPTFSKSYVPPLFGKPSRLISERLYDVFEKPPLTETVGSNLDKPAAEILVNIPTEDSKRRFRTYYNIPDTPPPTQSVKGKGKDKKAAKADKKPGKNDKKAKKPDKGKKSAGQESIKPATPDSDKDDGYIINEQFDPFAQIDVSIFEDILEEEYEDDKVQCNMNTIPPVTQRQYKYNIYVIMYNYLEKAIMNIVDMIEMQPQEHIPYAVIKEIEEPNYTRRLIDLKGLLVQENMDKLKTKLILYNYRKNSKIDWKTQEIQRQLRNITSDSSLWSIMKHYEAKPKLPESKPISYPIEHYEGTKTKLSERDESFEKIPLMVNASTSTLDGRLDPNWEDFKEVTLQKDFSDDDRPDDLEAYVEKIISELSVQDLVDIRLDKETQKNFDEYVSDEEHFYQGGSDGGETDVSIDSHGSHVSDEEHFYQGGSDGGETDVSIDSHGSRESCSCEGYGACNKSEENDGGNLDGYDQ